MPLYYWKGINIAFLYTISPYMPLMLYFWSIYALNVLNMAQIYPFSTNPIHLAKDAPNRPFFFHHFQKSPTPLSDVSSPPTYYINLSLHTTNSEYAKANGCKICHHSIISNFKFHISVQYLNWISVACRFTPNKRKGGSTVRK